MRFSILLTTTVLALGSVATNAQVPDASDDRLWSRLFGELTKLVTPGLAAGAKVPGLQMVVSDEAADWDDRNKYGAGNFLLFANRLVEPGDVFVPAEQSHTLYEQFGLFLGAIDFPGSDESPAQKQAREKARQAWLKASELHVRALERRGPAWEAFQRTQSSLPESARIGYHTWYNTKSGIDVGTLERESEKAAGEYGKHLAKDFRGIKDVHQLIANLNRHTLKGYRAPLEQDEQMPAFSISPSVKSFIDDGKAGKGNSKEVVLSESSSQVTFSWSRRGGGAGVKAKFFRAGGGKSSYSQALVTKLSNSAVSIRLGSLQAFDIEPGQWFNSTAITLLQEKGPYKPGVITRESLFGEGGSFKPRVSRVWLAMNPKITIKLDETAQKELLDSFGKSGSAGFGSFSFKASTAGGKSVATYDNKKNEVTFEDKSDVPKIVAVVISSYRQK